MPRPDLCDYCAHYATRECLKRCRVVLAAYDTGHTEGRAEGVTAERERWRAVVEGAIANLGPGWNRARLLEYMRHLRKIVEPRTGEIVLLELLEAQEQP